MPELTLADLVAWDRRLRLPHAASSNGQAASLPGDRWPERELTWAVTAKASAPMLPLLRGGELVILPGRVIAESGISLPLLLAELASHDVTGVVLDAPPPPAGPLPALLIDAITPDLESELNRLLTQRRGEIYRTGTEIGRRLSTLTAAGADVPQVLQAAAMTLGVPVGVVDARGTVIAASERGAVPEAATAANLAGISGWRGDHLAIPLANGETLWFGPVGRDNRALVRIAGERVAVSVEAALLRAAQARPRGAARSSAVAALLTGPPLEAPRIASSLGLAPDGRYQVVLGAPGVESVALQRFLAPLGSVHDAGSLDAGSAALVELRPDAARPGSQHTPHAPRDAASRRADRLRGASAWHGRPGQWVAVSGVAEGVFGIAAAMREARYVAALIDAGLVGGPVARFDVLDDLGAYRLLYRLWGSPDLDAFVADGLGDLVAADRRGVLRETLLAFLDTGGSHVEAAARLGIHRNTLAYRLKQIAACTGREPADPTARLVLHLALLAATLPPAPPGAP